MISVFLPEHPTLCGPRKREVSSPFFSCGSPLRTLGILTHILPHRRGRGFQSDTCNKVYLHPNSLRSLRAKIFEHNTYKKYFKYITRKNYDLHIKETNIHNLKFKYMKAKRIGLITVFDAILTGRQGGVKLQCLYENPMSNNFRKTSVWKKI